MRRVDLRAELRQFKHTSSGGHPSTGNNARGHSDWQICKNDKTAPGGGKTMQLLRAAVSGAVL